MPPGGRVDRRDEGGGEGLGEGGQAVGGDRWQKQGAEKPGHLPGQQTGNVFEHLPWT